MSVVDKIKHYQRNIEKCDDNEDRVCIDALIFHLLQTCNDEYNFVILLTTLEYNLMIISKQRQNFT